MSFASVSPLFFWSNEPAKWGELRSQLTGPLCLAIGNFDGVHLGHRELLSRTVASAAQVGGHAAAFTFFPHPQVILQPDRRHSRLFDFEDQREVLSKLGLAGVFVQPFTRAFSEVSAEDFVFRVLIDHLRADRILVGDDFQFGRGREGNAEVLRTLGQTRSVAVEIVPAVMWDSQRVSTSRIRACLLRGEVDQAERLLGRPYTLHGVIERGEQRGRSLGFPTANLRPFLDFYPRPGVYVSQCHSGGRSWKSVTNIGINKTFVRGDFHPLKVETYIFDFQGDLYGSQLKVDLLHFLRDEQRFSSVQDLQSQIQTDIGEARRWHQKR